MARQLAAQGGGTEDDFMPLNVGDSRSSSTKGRRGNDSDDDEIANEDMRIQFGDTRKVILPYY